MASWEIDVELRVRKTLVFGGPTNEAMAREIATMALRGGIDLGTLQKWHVGRGTYRPMPVETIIDNDPQIVAIRELP